MKNILPSHESQPPPPSTGFKMPYMIFQHPLYRSLKATPRAVYMYLLFRSNGGGEAWPTMETIGDDLARSPKQVSRDVNELVRVGLVTTTKVWKRYHYTVLLPDEVEA